MKKFFKAIHNFFSVLSLRSYTWYVVMILIAIGAWVFRTYSSADAEGPADWTETVLRKGDMQVKMTGRDSVVSLRKGEEVRVLGYTPGKQLWVETANGLRGLADQQLFSDTMYLTERHKGIARGDTLLWVNLVSEKNSRTAVFHTLAGEEVEFKVYSKGFDAITDVEIPSIFNHPDHMVTARGWGAVSQKEFEKAVVGKTLAEVDSTFSRALYSSPTAATLGVKVFNAKAREFVMPTLTIGPDGLISDQIGYTPLRRDYTGIRGFVINHFPFAADIMWLVAPTLTHPMYSESSSASDISWQKKLGIADGAKTKWWQYVIVGIIMVVYIIAMLLQWFGFYCVLPFVPVLILQMLALKPWPFKFIPNRVLFYIFTAFNLLGFYAAIVISMASPESLWLFTILFAIWFGVRYVSTRGYAIVQNRCPVCKTLDSYVYDHTEYPPEFNRWETTTNTHTLARNLVNTYQTWTRVTYSDGTHYDKDRQTHHEYDVTQRHDHYRVLYHVKPYIDFTRCEECGRILKYPGEKKEELDRELLGINVTHHTETT